MKSERTGCIYRYHRNGKSYIGQTVNLKQRKRNHKRALENYPFQNAIRKHGIDSFEFEILEDNIPESKLDKHERFWIKRFDCVHPNGYNMTDGGNRPIISEATRAKMRESGKNKFFSKEHRENLSKAGEGRIAWNKGERHSVETKKKISKAGRGRKFSNEHRARISAALKGKERSPEHCVNLGNSRRGHKHTEESKLKMKKAHTGKKQTPEHAKKRAESLKRNRRIKLRCQSSG